MKHVLTALAFIMIVGSAFAATQEDVKDYTFNGKWYGLNCYGCPFKITDEGKKVNYAADEFNLNMAVKNEIDIAKANYEAAYGKKGTDTFYRNESNFTKERVEKVSDAALSTSAAAYPWVNLANYLIHEVSADKKDYATALEAVKAAQEIMSGASDLSEDTGNHAWDKWNKDENKRRKHVNELIERRIQNLKDLKAWTE